VMRERKERMIEVEKERARSGAWGSFRELISLATRGEEGCRGVDRAIEALEEVEEALERTRPNRLPLEIRPTCLRPSNLTTPPASVNRPSSRSNNSSSDHRSTTDERPRTEEKKTTTTPVPTTHPSRPRSFFPRTTRSSSRRRTNIVDLPRPTTTTLSLLLLPPPRLAAKEVDDPPSSPPRPRTITSTLLPTLPIDLTPTRLDSSPLTSLPSLPTRTPTRSRHRSIRLRRRVARLQEGRARW
jgi:hypothetical protein